MNLKKRLTSLMLSALLMFFNVSAAFAVNFTDLSTDYWAYEQISELSQKGVIAGYPDETFKPENSVSRAEFTKMVIKVLDKDESPLAVNNDFTDITSDFWAHDDILRSVELGLVVGYPDHTFRPLNGITKSEATSIISKTIKDCEKSCDCAESCDCEQSCNCEGPCPLEQEKDCSFKKFTDQEEIADWAKQSFKKAIKNELYVNYPDENYLTPNKNMTRAETAALLYKLRQKPTIVSAEYQGPDLQESCQKIEAEKPVAEKLFVEEYKTIVEHLPANVYTEEVNEVEIKGNAVKVLANNVLPVKFEEVFKSKKSKQNDVVYLVFDKNVTTEEGTNIIPAGSKIAAEIIALKKGRLFNRNGKVELEVNNLVTPSGQVYPLTGTIVNSEILKKNFGKCNLKRAGIITTSTAAVGSLLGFFIGLGSGDFGEGAGLGAIIGGCTGLVAGVVAPGCSVEIDQDQDIYIKLNNDLEIDIEE